MAADGSNIDMLDTWIESLMSCTPLAEPQVKQLCDKVRPRTGLPAAWGGGLGAGKGVGGERGRVGGEDKPYMGFTASIVARSDGLAQQQAAYPIPPATSRQMHPPCHVIGEIGEAWQAR